MTCIAAEAFAGVVAECAGLSEEAEAAGEKFPCCAIDAGEVIARLRAAGWTIKPPRKPWA